ncbi:MAG: tetratricopeptide repeat protein [Candidatus Omnitrophica bacterium]|nr:tetratricopeptide repeat protein [Candidatus Omnitrophota bacterium]
MFKKIFWGLIIIFLCSSAISYAQGQGKEEVFFVARKAFEDGYYEVSIGLLNRFLDDFPYSSKTGEAELLLGQSYFYQSKLIEALGKFEELLNKPSAANVKDAVLYWIAETYFKANNFPKAAQAYRKVIDGFPNSSYAPLALYSLGRSLFEEGNFKEALSYFKAMEERYAREPQALDASFKIVECLYKLKDYPALKDKAKQALKLFAKDTPKLAYLYFYIAESEYSLDNFNQSLDYYKKALKESSDIRVQALSRLGAAWSYLKLKDYKKAESEFALVKDGELDKNGLEALLLGRGESLLKQGKLKEAKQEFEKVTNVNDEKPVKEVVLVQIADIYQDLGEYTEAIEAYKSILTGFPQGVYRDYVIYRIGIASYYLGLDCFQRQDYEGSIKIMERYRKDSRDIDFPPDAAYLLGSCYYNLGNFKKAIELFKEVITLSQDTQLLQKAEYALADSLYNLGKEKEALALFNALRSRYPGSDLTARVLFWLAGYYYQQDNLDLSARYFLSLVQDFPNSGLAAESYYSMGLISVAKGKTQDAIADFKKAAQLGNPSLKALSMFAQAEALEVKGEFNAAVKEYLKISGDDKFKERAFLRIARIYEDRENFKEAVKFYKQVIAMGGKSASYVKERLDWIEFNIKK